LIAISVRVEEIESMVVRGAGNAETSRVFLYLGLLLLWQVKRGHKSALQRSRTRAFIVAIV
jgi:hypothetical protein